MPTKQQLARIIDNTFLKDSPTHDEVVEFCERSAEYGFGQVCIKPEFVKAAKNALEGQGVKVVSVIGFPDGTTDTSKKMEEAKQAVEDGADELDMVMNIEELKEGNHEKVLEDIKAVVSAAKGRPVKAIIEAALLSNDEKIKACEIAMDAGASFVKTGTGYKGPATVEDVKLMKSAVGDKVGIKAAGGISSLDKAIAMIEAGATRIGTSSGFKIIDELKAKP